MRFHPTPSEALLWSQLRGKRLGVVFRRQVIIGSHIVDFLAPSVRLVVEVDGDSYHAQRSAADAARDAKLRRGGYSVLRIEASVVERKEFASAHMRSLMVEPPATSEDIAFAMVVAWMEG